MIYVIEIPHQMPPVAWTAKDESELIAKVSADRAGVVYERTTVRELIDLFRSATTQEAPPWMSLKSLAGSSASRPSTTSSSSP